MEGFKIDINKSVTSRLSIEPEKTTTGAWKYEGLVMLKWVGISLGTVSFEKGQFAGLECKTLNFDFTNYKLNASDPDRFLTHQEKIIGTVKKDGSDYVDMDAKTVAKFITNMWNRIKHILDATHGGVNHRDIIANKEFLKLIDFPMTSDAATIVAHFNKFFEFIVTFATGDGKTTFPIWQSKDGSPLCAWGKILPEYNDGKWYEFPSFVGTGFIEKISFGDKNIPNMAKIIKVKPSETLELRAAKKANTTANASNPNIAPGEIPNDIANLLFGSPK
jgi:hypothetical protein